MPYGLTDEGFIRKSLTQIVSDLEDAMRSSFGQNVKLDTKSVFGKLVGTFAQPLADVWELAESVYNAMYPNTATTSAALEGSAELVGVTKKPGIPSAVQVVLEGTVGTLIASESKIATENIGDQFQTTDDVTLDATLAVTANTTLLGAVTNGKTYTITINGNPYTYVATVPPDGTDDVGTALEAAINGGADPVTATHTGGGVLDIVGDDDPDGLLTAFSITVNANVRLVTVGNLHECESVEVGLIQAFAGTLNQIVNPISGWTAAWNPLDAVLGEPEETDAALRARRSVSLAIPGAGTPEAMLAGLLAIDGVTAAIVIENTDDEVDVFGLPPHSMECVVEGGAEEDIGEVLWARKGGGIKLHGDESVVVEDSQGYDHVLEYSRPTNVLQWLRATYTKYDEEDFPVNGEATMAAALLEYGNSLGLGKDVLPDRFLGPVFDAVAGIETLVVERADDVVGVPGPYSTDPKSIEFREIAKFDSGRISIVAA